MPVYTVQADVVDFATERPRATDALWVDTDVWYWQTSLGDYDQLTLHGFRSVGISQVLTDDGDFCTVAGITLFTANRGVIQAAQSQGRLIVR